MVLNIVFSVQLDIFSFQRNPVVFQLWKMEGLPNITILLKVITFQ